MSCKFIDGAGKALDPWCSVHRRSAVCCYNELQAKYEKAVIHATDEESQKWTALAKIEKLKWDVQQATDCGKDNVCGTVGEQCQKCLRQMFNREAELREKVKEVLDTILDGINICSDTECSGHCGFGAYYGCAAIKEYLGDRKLDEELGWLDNYPFSSKQDKEA